MNVHKLVEAIDNKTFYADIKTRCGLVLGVPYLCALVTDLQPVHIGNEHQAMIA